MEMRESILKLLNARKNNVLLVAQAALPDQQFSAFKKVFLNEFGMRGLETDLIRLFENSSSKNHRVGNGQE